MSQRSEFLERVVEAELDGAVLPEPTSDEEKRELALFEQTRALFAAERAELGSEAWVAKLWERIDAAASSDAPLADSEAIGSDAKASVAADAAGEPEDAESSEKSSTSAKVIDARRRWPWLGALVAAAAVLFVVVWTRLPADPGAATSSSPQAAAKHEAAAPAEAREAGESEEAAPDETGSATLIAKAEGDADRWGEAPSGFDATAEPSAGSYGLPPSPGRGAGRGAGGPSGSMGGDGKADKGFGMGEKAGKTNAGFVADDSLRPDPAPKDRAKPPTEPASKPADASTRTPVTASLSAGDIDDNRDFEAFTTYLNGRAKQHLEPIDVSERIFVRVLDADDKPVPNAEVQFRTEGRVLFTARTFSDGSTLFHPRTKNVAAPTLEVVISANGASTQFTVERGSQERWQVRLPSTRVLPKHQLLDIVFLVDTTSSMSDEIERLQSTFVQVAADVAALPSQPQARFGLVLFRDDGDEYVSELYAFESDVARFQTTLAKVTASGGGDIPERLELGLHRAVHEMQWDPSATKLVVLVGDAPPHEARKNTYSYAQDLEAAVGLGIKIFPVATSGLNDDGEYVFRQIAQFTSARFVFLTYGASGTSTPHHVAAGSFQPESLDRLIVRLVREELAALQL